MPVPGTEDFHAICNAMKWESFERKQYLLNTKWCRMIVYLYFPMARVLNMKNFNSSYSRLSKH